MPPLPVISGKEAVRRFERLGYTVVRQRSSHIRMKHPHGDRLPLTVPDHKVLGRGLLRKLMRDAKVTVREFIQLADA